jgi:hypothetical protein
VSHFSLQICAIASIARKKKESFFCCNQCFQERKEAFCCYNQSMLSRNKRSFLVVATMRSITPSVDKVRKKDEEDCLRSLICQLLQLSFSLSFCFAKFCFLSLRTMIQRILMEITGQENQKFAANFLKKTLKRKRDSKAIFFCLQLPCHNFY